MSPHVVPKSSLVAPMTPADEEKTAVDSSWEDEQSTIDQAEMADKVRRALAEKRRAGTGSSAGNGTGSTTGTTGGHNVDEPTVEDRARPGIEAAALGIARLLVEVGPDAGKDFQLRSGKPVLVGRAIDNTVVLTDLSVSRKHLEITWDGRHWTLNDRGSGNGTLLNGKLEEGSFRLFNNDRIEIGHTTFRFEQAGAAGRNQWSEEEPSTIAGRRTNGNGGPSAIQTSEFDAHPGESAAISMVERKPIPLPMPDGPDGRHGRDARNAGDLHRRPTAAPSPNPYTNPAAAPGSPGLPPPSSPQFLGAQPRPALGQPDVAPANHASHANSGLAATGTPFPPASRSTNLGTPPASSPHNPLGPLGPLGAPLGAPTRSSPMSTLPGRPPIVGPTAPPLMGEGLVPPRQVAIPAEMIPGMNTVPHPRSLVGPPMSRPTLSAQHERAMAPRMMSRNEPLGDSGVAVQAPRFNGQHSQQSHPSMSRRAEDESVPRLTRQAKTTVALVAGGVVLLVAVIALAMSSSGEAVSTASTGSGSDITTAPDGSANASVVPIDPPVKSAELQAAEKAAAEKLAAAELATQKAAIEKAAIEKAAAEKAAAEQAALEQTAAEKAAAEKLAAEQAEQLAAKKLEDERLAAEKAERNANEKTAAQKLAADKAEKAAAAKAERLAAEKAAAERIAAAKAKAKKEKETPKRVEKEKERVAVVETRPPETELDSEAVLGKAEDLYRKKNFAAAASTIREAIRGRTSGTDELRATAQIYEALQRTYAAGTAVGAKPTDAYTNLRSAARYDDKLGKVHSDDINPRITALAPRAAAQFLALKQYEEAFQALRDAERAGASSSTLNAVRTAVDAHANELYNQAQAKRADDPSAARSLYKKVLKLVESGSPLYQKASKGITETT